MTTNAQWQRQRIREIATKILYVCLCIASFFLPLSEGVTQGALIAATVCAVVAGHVRFDALRRSGDRIAALIAVGISGWVIVGAASTLASKTLIRSSSLNKALLALGVLLGIALMRRARDIELKPLLLFLIAGSTVAAIAGVCQLSLGSFPFEQALHNPKRGVMGQLYIPGTDYRAATGTLRNRTKLAEALIFVLASFSALGAISITTRAKRAAQGLLIAFFLLLVFTFTKASLVAVTVATLSTHMLEHRHRMRRWIAPMFMGGIVLGVLASVYAGATLPRANHLTSPDMWTTRRFIWQHAIDMGCDHPWIGVGLGAYAKASRPYFVDADKYHAFTLNAHSQHLTAWVETGVVGLFFWTLLGIGIAFALARAWKRELSSNERVLRHIATYTLIALASMSLVHDVLFHPVTALLAWMSVGILAAFRDHGDKKKQPVSL